MAAEEMASRVNVPFVGVPFIPSNRSVTQVKPFSFEERDKNMLALKQEKIRRVIEEQKKVVAIFVCIMYFCNMFQIVSA